MKKIIILLILVYSSIFAQSGWFWQNPLPQGNTLNSVFFYDTNSGWAVGNYGVILHTINGGSTWIAQNTVTHDLLYDVCFIDANTGWAVGDNGMILHTTNSGNTWNTQFHSTNDLFTDVYFIDSNTGWVVGLETILHTSNGGETWFNQNYQRY